jgi:hypothetical protein
MPEATTMVGDSDLSDAVTDQDLKTLDREIQTQTKTDGDGETKTDEPNQTSTQSQDNNDDDDDESSARHTAEENEAASEEEREQIRARRKKERLARRQHQKDRFETLQRTVESTMEQNRMLQQRLGQLERSDQAAQIAQLDDAIKESEDLVNRFTSIHADAVAKNDGVTATRAIQSLLSARDRYTQLSGVKQQINQAQSAPSPVDPSVAKNAQIFHSRNNWYKGPQSTDQDSVIMTSLDTAVAREGFLPNTPAYWKELEARAKKYLPHRYASADAGSGQQPTNEGGESGYNQDERGPRSPVGGSSQRGNSGGQTKGEFKLSKERVSAMKEAGLWDDPGKRAKQIAAYRKYDTEQS